MTASLVRIQWLDSKGVVDAWEFIDGLKPMKPCACVSVGFLIDDHPDYKTIALTMSEDQVLGRLTIPMCAIQNIAPLAWSEETHA